MQAKRLYKFIAWGFELAFLGLVMIFKATLLAYHKGNLCKKDKLGAARLLTYSR